MPLLQPMLHRCDGVSCRSNVALLCRWSNTTSTFYVCRECLRRMLSHMLHFDVYFPRAGWRSTRFVWVFDAIVPYGARGILDDEFAPHASDYAVQSNVACMPQRCMRRQCQNVIASCVRFDTGEGSVEQFLCHDCIAHLRYLPVVNLQIETMCDFCPLLDRQRSRAMCNHCSASFCDVHGGTCSACDDFTGCGSCLSYHQCEMANGS